MLRKCGKPVILAVNKCDTIGELPPDFYEFYNLGLGDPIAISSVHGHGSGDLLDEVLKYLPDEPAEERDEDDYIKVAVIGKPNAGKSSLVNAVLGEERMIVSDIAGTTRDSTDSIVENEHGKFVFIDTAGLRRKSKVYDQIEKYSVIRARMAVERAQVCVIMIDGTEGFTEQDSKVAGIAHEMGKGCIIAVNKWDTENARRISTGKLNEVLADATARVQPPSDKGRRLKIYYMTQASTRPPTFVCFVNSAELFHYSYQRYIDNRIREVFGLEGTPTRMVIREREQKKK